MLSRLVITFLPRSKCLLISWLQSPSAVILEPPKIKPETASTVFPSISHEVMGPCHTMILVFVHQEAFQFLFTLCRKGGVICISVVIAGFQEVKCSFVKKDSDLTTITH